MTDRLTEDCNGCGGFGYRVVAGRQKECPWCGKQAQREREIEAAEAAMEDLQMGGES